MTVLNLETSQGAWFDMDGGGRVQLRTLTYDDIKRIDKLCVKKRVDFKKVEGTPARFEYLEENDDLRNELFWDHCIVNWENLFDLKEKEIPCTKENKVLLMTRSAQFVKFVMDSLETLRIEEEKHAGLAEKNSMTP